MNNEVLINRLKDINEAFINQYGINKSNIGFNLLNKLIDALYDEIKLSGFSGSDKKRIALALKLQKEGFKSSRPILGLFHIRDDNKQVFVNHYGAYIVLLDEANYIKEVKTSDDQFVYSDKNNYYSYDPSLKNTYPETKKIMLKSYNEVEVDNKDFMAFINAYKKCDIISLIIDSIKYNVNCKYLYEVMILSNNYKKDVITLKYIADNKPLQIDDNILITLLKYDGETIYPSFIVR